MSALDAMIARAVTGDGDAQAAAKVVAACRFQLGMTYAETLERVQRDHPKTTMADWDALLYEAEG